MPRKRVLDKYGRPSYLIKKSLYVTIDVVAYVIYSFPTVNNKDIVIKFVASFNQSGLLNNRTPFKFLAYRNKVDKLRYRNAYNKAKKLFPELDYGVSSEYSYEKAYFGVDYEKTNSVKPG